ncbi:MAG TPA: DUF4139 domain-containing protein [Acidobacteriaceae bacterium]|jgi:hypothetical protein
MRPSVLAPVFVAPFLLLPLSAQHTTAPRPATASVATVNNDLPVTRVSLYKNGVGFFEHAGHINGDATVTIDFTTAQLNDVLQSLTAIDLNGGRISGAGYNSTTPLEQQLKSLPLALGEDTTALDFYTAIRGARVEVHSGTISITGRLLSVEDRAVPTKSDDDNTHPITQHFLTVVSDSGEVRTLELTSATSVRLLDADLHGNVARYLQLLARNRSQGLRHLSIEDHGTGSRELHVSYISEVPIWKSTYRILLTNPADHSAAKTATVQGWAVVDNTVGADWVNVQLSLIAGSPQSFVQPLSDPIYARRPEIPIAQEAQLTPQTFDSMSNQAPSPVMAARAAPVMADKFVGGMRSPDSNSVTYGIGAGAGIGPGSPGSAGGPTARRYATVSNEALASDSLAISTQTAAFDDFFEYKLNEPVTIRKNESAMVPILQAKVPVEQVTIVGYTTPWQTSQPLRALWVTNDTNLTFDRGSFSIVEDGNFSGEGLLAPIRPGGKRLLSYAADQAIHVSAEDHSTQQLSGISVSKGVVRIQRTQHESQTYVVHNSAGEQRTVLLEYPVNPMMTLDDSTAKPVETTPTVYRFRLTVAPNGTATFPVAAHGIVHSEWALTDSDDSRLATIFQQTDNSPQFQAAIQPVLDARRKVADAQTAVNQVQAHLKDLHAEEERQRANITALNNADKSSRDRFVHDLNTTEDEIKAANADLTSRTAALDAAKTDLANRIESLQFDETI